MSKLGTAYQELVAEVIKSFDSNNDIIVEEGLWVNGPDGQRDIDVSVRGVINGKEIFILIECKDYSKKTGKVGINIIDEIDSKRHDLNADIAIISSNSGFTEPALNKARRKDIVAISVLKEGDERVKIEIEQEIYYPKHTFGEFKITYNGPDVTEQLKSAEWYQIKYKGKFIDSWLIMKAQAVTFLNEVSGKDVIYTANFITQTEFDFEGSKIKLDSIAISFRSEAEWFSQPVKIDASKGLYDYLRKGVRLSAGENRYMVKGVNLYEGTKLKEKPSKKLFSGDRITGEVDIQLALSIGIPTKGLDTELAPLEEIIVPEDLDLILK